MANGVNIFVAGRTQSGKSHLLKQLVADCPRLLVYQTKREDCGYPGVYFDAARGERIAFLSWWGHAVQVCGRFRLVYRPANPYSVEEINFVCALVHTCGSMVLVCEEIMTYLASYDPQKPGVEGITSLLTAGSTAGVTCYLVSQKPCAINHLITSQARIAYLFATHEPSHVSYLRQAFGQEAADRLAGLGQYEYVFWDDTGPERIVQVGKAKE